MSFVARRDDGSFYAFYDASWWNLDNITARGQDLERAIQSHGAYTTSKDGIHWEKPILGLIEGPADIDGQRHAPYPSPKGTTRENNLLSAPNIFDLGQFGNVSEPDKRYKVENYFVSELPEFSASFFLDNPNWRENITKTGIKLTLPPRGSFGFWDDIHQEWVGMSQGVSGHWIPSRDIARFSTKDFVNWTAQTVMYPDPADSHFPHQYDEPYSLGTFCAEGVVFGLLNWYHSDRTHPDGGPVWEPTPEHPYR